MIDDKRTKQLTRNEWQLNDQKLTTMNADKSMGSQLTGSLDVPMSNPAKAQPHANNNALFFRLPFELRNGVYEYVLGINPSTPGQPPILGSMVRWAHMPKRIRQWEVDREPALLRVCRIIRAESRIIYYAGRRFIARIERSDISLFTSWIAWVGQAHLSRVDSVNLLMMAKQPFDAEVIYSLAEAFREVQLPIGKWSVQIYIGFRDPGKGFRNEHIIPRSPSTQVIHLLIETARVQNWNERMVYDWVAWARRSYGEKSLDQFWQKFKEIDWDNRKPADAWSQARNNGDHGLRTIDNRPNYRTG